MRFFILLYVILAALVTVGCDPTWTLTFQDDFNGTALNPNYWNIADNYTHTDLELELYLADEVFVEDNYLILRTQKRYAS